MGRIFTALPLLAVLAACDNANPFMLEVTQDPADTEGVVEGDPNVDVNNRYAYDLGQRLTMNSVDVDDNGTPGDTSYDVLVINNLPFDGPDGRYVRNEVLANGASVYRSQQTETTGTTLTFAVFIQSDYLEATGAASGQWIDFGYAGANINRESFNLPGGVGEYIYRGNYAATRTFSDRGGIEIVSGDAFLRLDVLDFDPSGELQSAIDGTIFNREREGTAGTLGLGDLPPIILSVTSFNTETGVWEGGSATTSDLIGDVRDSGIHDGMIAGPNGEEMGGYTIVTGAADIQRVTYQVVRYRTTTTIPVLDPLTGQPAVDPISGDPIVSVITTTGTSSGLDDVDLQGLQNLINARGNLPDFLPATGVPAGAEIIDNSTLFGDFTTEYDAREIGIFIGDQVIPTP